MDADGCKCNFTHIIRFIQEIDRVLLPSGHLFLWVDKFHLCQGVLQWLQHTELNLVDMVVWNKGKIGMGYRTRRKSEYLIVCQKSPVRAKGIWTLHNIPDVWDEKTPKTHPHSKPLGLQKALVEATTQEGDWVLDPASGGYSVLTACQELNRNFIGCDIEFGEEPIHNEDNRERTTLSVVFYWTLHICNFFLNFEPKLLAL